MTWKSLWKGIEGNIYLTHNVLFRLYQFLSLRNLSKDVLDIESDLPNEYMYGRAGYLFAILYVNKQVYPPPFEDIFITEVCYFFK